MIIKRLFSTQPSRRFLIDILNENSGSILAFGVIGSGIFGVGLYINQMRVYEEKINAVKMEAKKDTDLAEEKINTVKTVADEKINTVKMEAKRDVMEAKNEALQNLYNIFTQEEYKEAKKTLLAQKNKIVNSE